MDAISSDPITDLLTTYNELNSSTVTILDEAPSALEFMRFVALNRPFIVRGFASDWKATSTWSLSYLRSTLSSHEVNVAVTPHGNADSPTLNDDGDLVFVKPWEEPQSFPEFVDFVSQQELHERNEEEVRYAQTQNDNLRNEYSSLFSDVEQDISFARIALQQDPDAINLWIGNSHSITSLHKDPYQNIYVQILGQKHFTLLPPLFHPCINEVPLPSTSYVRSTSDPATLTIKPDSPSVELPIATWDPDVPSRNPTKYSHLAQPMHVTLEKGDMLYLPALWYHKVGQSCGEDGICVAANYWYDMDFGGSFWPLCNFVRSVSLQDEAKKESTA
ncbi:putative phospholipase a2 protein [Botrytis fragariae]|uniref:Putative phospholipase a2 protein n=1 Tax=Botrytis fragariae TaxID=1964551 RepID=A0A8H6B1I2_9HELO|nr:putative phospholipase a2 protein [Botrytis fragariae]KAF5877387.1 putative phospholipase a2 protein [Botrytis fragariae]